MPGSGQLEIIDSVLNRGGKTGIVLGVNGQTCAPFELRQHWLDELASGAVAFHECHEPIRQFWSCQGRGCLNLSHATTLHPHPTWTGKTSSLVGSVPKVRVDRHLLPIEGFEVLSPLDTESIGVVMRQDPDVILVGEMRDPETAMAALKHST